MNEDEKALLLGSSNPGKQREMQALLGNLPLRLLRQEDLGQPIAVVETGHTYAENASLKAVTLAQRFEIWTLADDTGLEVDALDGAPGLHSARLLEKGASDAQRRERLLELLEAVPTPWKARFRCVAALASSQGEIALAEGVCEGEIIPVERGVDGFGYDPIFVVARTGKTMAELSLEEKNFLSHRGRAVNALLPELRELLGIRD